MIEILSGFCKKTLEEKMKKNSREDNKEIIRETIGKQQGNCLSKLKGKIVEFGQNKKYRCVNILQIILDSNIKCV